MSAAQRRPPRQLTELEQAQRTEQWFAMCELVDEVRRSLDQKFPDLPEATRHREFAEFYITNQLGEEWASRNLNRAVGKQPRAYLRPDPDHSFERHERYVRTMELARRLFELGQEPFYGRLVKNLSSSDLEGAAFEADAVRLLLAAPFQLDLRERQGTRGDDYDIDLWLSPEDVWSIEVKTRADTVEYTDRALAKTLENARSQLPPGGVGTIFFKVPTPWLSSGVYRRGYADVVARFLRSTTRVHGVVLVWDHWTPKTFGRGFNWSRKTRIFRALTPEPLVGYLLDLYEQLWAEPFDIGPTAPF